MSFIYAALNYSRCNQDFVTLIYKCSTNIKHHNRSWFALSDVSRSFLSWYLLCLHAGDDQGGAGGTEGLVL